MPGSPYTSGWGPVFFVSAAAAAALTWRSVSGGANDAAGQKPDAEFRAFQRSYLMVYYLAMLADWLQGPYVYALYHHYNFSIAQIGQLFIAGFGSSMVFGGCAPPPPRRTPATTPTTMPPLHPSLPWFGQRA